MSSTRLSSDNLIPLTDPEVIIRAASAARRKAKLDAVLQDRNPVTPPNLTLSTTPLHNLPQLPTSPVMSGNPAPTSAGHPANTQKVTVHPSNSAGGSSLSQAQPHVDALSLQEYLKSIMELQHRSIDLANLDRQAERARREASQRRRPHRTTRGDLDHPVRQEPTRPEPGRLDLQRFRVEGPYYTGPFQEVEPFITWFEGVEIVFTTKGITNDDDKLSVMGMLIREGQTQRFYAHGISKFLGNSWANFKTKLLNFALPPLWRTDLREKLRHLEMTNSESFLDYSNRSKTLQNMLNFESESVSDFVNAAVRQVRVPVPWIAPLYISRRPLWLRPYRQAGSHQSAVAQLPHRQLANRPNRRQVALPGCSVTVSGVAEDSTEQDLDRASLSAISAIDQELQLALSEGYVPPASPHCLIIHFTHKGQDLRGLIDTGSEVNIISTTTIERMQMATFESAKPTIVNLAMDNTGLKPIILQHSVKLSLLVLRSPLTFDDIILKVGPIKGDYDMILGIHFLSKFNLSASIFYHSLQCARSGCNIFDYRVPTAIQKKFSSYYLPSVAAIESGTEYPCKASEKIVLEEFKDLFPEDIPAVSDAAESKGLFTDGAFPDKLQLESSKVRHKIVLTNPDIIVNKRQYPYPQKYLAAWQTLLEQHLTAGRI
ncbi:hypothetical protein Pst134EA_019437 [Puccinia striiformis f. sp. tritici]|uniref:hypothetical protein n=1 Tax=Puccinia striiformis f. sp. tritici TaxID=168172 RepID=UPI0020074715|nr:hypothetical protein Pst134EA_019437 [Puccinia striiformis f. sp. tritici]KAH9459282.1 hypothetical protein Pst134EA_019437 [Puccinia striiformis f. sp. tritici]